MNEKDKIRIRHILDAIAEIEEYTQSFTEEKFIEHRLVRLPVKSEL